MTRTQKLGLCTWLPEDPVCLAEVNDNFSRLDTSGARALRQAEAGLIALGGVMAAQAHQGGHAAYSDCIQAGAFSDMTQVADYSGVYFLNQCAELLTSGLAGGVVHGNSNTNDFNASNIARTTKLTQTWVKLFNFYPDAYGQLTSLKLLTTATASSTTAAYVKLAIWDAETEEVLCETALGTITRASSAAENPVTLSAPLLLDPNRRYAMMVWVESMPGSTFSMSTVTFNINTKVFQSGSIQLNALEIPAGCTRAEVLLHASTDTAQAALRFDSGAFTTLTAARAKADKIPGGTACTLLRFGMDVPSDAESVQLRLSLPSTACKIYDFALVLL